MEQDLENLASTPVLEPVEETVEESIPPAVASSTWLDDTGIEIVRATRSWIQYGTVGFAVVCIIIGAVEALFGR